MHTTSIEFTSAGQTTVLPVNAPSHAVPTGTTTLPSGETYRAVNRAGREPLHSEVEDALRASGTLVDAGPMPPADPPDEDVATELLAGFAREAAGFVSRVAGPFEGVRQNQARNLVDYSRTWFDLGISRDARFKAVRKHIPTAVFDDAALMVLVVAAELRGLWPVGSERKRIEEVKAARERALDDDRKYQAAVAAEATTPAPVTFASIGCAGVLVDSAVNCAIGNPADHPLGAILANAKHLPQPDGGRIVLFNLSAAENREHGRIELDRGVTLLGHDATLVISPDDLRALVRRCPFASPPGLVLQGIFNARRADTSLDFGPLDAAKLAGEPEDWSMRFTMARALLSKRGDALLQDGEPNKTEQSNRWLLVQELVRGCKLGVRGLDLALAFVEGRLLDLPKHRAVTQIGMAAKAAIEGRSVIAIGESLPKVTLAPGQTDPWSIVLGALVEGKDSVAFGECRSAIETARVVPAGSWSNIESRKITQTLRALSFERAFVLDDGRKARRFVRGAAVNEDSEDVQDPAPSPHAVVPEMRGASTVVVKTRHGDPSKAARKRQAATVEEAEATVGEGEVIEVG